MAMCAGKGLFYTDNRRELYTEPSLRNVCKGIIISLLATGCTIHEPTYYTIYTPERRSTNLNEGASGFSTNGQMNTTIHANSGNPNAAGSTVNENSRAGAYFNSSNQLNYPGPIYAEVPGTIPSPVSSNSASRIYSEAGNQAQNSGRGSMTGSLPNSQNTLWLPQDQGMTASDRAIIREIRKAWNQYYELSLAATGLKIIADNGKVVVSGTVGTEQEKERLEALVQSIPGLVSVQYHLAVKAGS